METNYDRLAADALLARGPTQIRNGRTRIVVANLTKDPTFIRKGTHLGSFTESHPGDATFLPFADPDRPQLQAAIDAQLQTALDAQGPGLVSNSSAAAAGLVSSSSAASADLVSHPSAAAARAQAERDLIPLYLDHLNNEQLDSPLNEEGIPIDVNLEGMCVTDSERAKFKTFLAKYPHLFSKVRGVPGTAKGLLLPHRDR